MPISVKTATYFGNNVTTYTFIQFHYLQQYQSGRFASIICANSFTEKIFKGPLHTMLQDTLSHIRSMVIEEKVVKHPERTDFSIILFPP